MPTIEKFRSRIFAKYSSAKKQHFDPRPMLREALDDCGGVEERYYVLYLLSLESQIRDDIEGAEQALIGISELFPTLPSSWLALSKFYACRKNDPAASMSALDKVFSGICEVEKLARYIHSEKIRIAICLGRQDLATDALQALLRAQRGSGKEEYKLEGDFLAGLRELCVSSELISEYETLLERERSNATPN